MSELRIAPTLWNSASDPRSERKLSLTCYHHRIPVEDTPPLRIFLGQSEFSPVRHTPSNGFLDGQKTPTEGAKTQNQLE